MSPIGKDLSYPAKKAIAVENQVDRIKFINQGFKLSGILCRLEVNKNSLLIRYKDLDGKRRSISPPNCDLSPPGILAAQNMATIISQALRLRNYSQEWLDLEIFHKTDKVKPIVLTIGTVRNELPDRWLKYRSGDRDSTDRQKLNTLTNYVRVFNRLIKSAKLSDDRQFNDTTIKLLLDLHAEGTDKKFRAKESLSIICVIFGIFYSFKGIGKRPKAQSRQLPTDDKIIETYNLIGELKGTNPTSAKYYQWTFGMLATYGLRPQELFAIDLSKSFNPKFDNWLYLDGNLCEGIKTGNRIVPPLLPEWVELFNLKCVPKSPATNSKLSVRGRQISEYFLLHKLGIRPYDLRHSYAIRTRRYFSLLDAANAMGHDIATHTKIYQRWISDTDRIESVRQGLRERGHL